MSWFQLDPKSISARARGSLPPSLGAFVIRGALGFAVVSVAGFAPWAFAGRWLRSIAGEAGVYIACLAVFLGLTGPLLHRLILGSGSPGRFYKLFTPAFSAYAVAWIVAWMCLRGDAGSITGLLVATAIMGWMLATAFGAEKQAIKIILALFVLNTLGYYAGGWLEATLPKLNGTVALGLSKSTRLTLGMLMWGVCYGLGLGAGLGIAFYLCQAEARRLIAVGTDNPQVVG